MKRMINRAMPVIISTLLVQVFTFLLPIHVGAASCTSTTRKRNSSSIACSHKLQRNFIGNTKSSNVYSNSERSTTSVISVLRGGDIISTTTTTTATVNSILYGLDVFGTVIFAFSGALKAGRKGMDLVGMMIIASITAVGGGTLRDVLMMGRESATAVYCDNNTNFPLPSPSSYNPVVFWMKTPLYLELCCVTAVITYYVWPKLSKKFGLDDSEQFICISDALGLAAFCVVGVQQATKRRLAPILCVVSGLMTSCFGGIIRDVICGEQPRIMYPHRSLYALGPALGACVYTILDRSQSYFSNIRLLNPSSITIISFLVAFCVRILSFNKPWRMPHWNIDNTKREERN